MILVTIIIINIHIIKIEFFDSLLVTISNVSVKPESYFNGNSKPLHKTQDICTQWQYSPLQERDRYLLLVAFDVSMTHNSLPDDHRLVTSKCVRKNASDAIDTNLWEIIITHKMTLFCLLPLVTFGTGKVRRELLRIILVY